jgi:hypothetical protein
MALPIEGERMSFFRRLEKCFAFFINLRRMVSEATAYAQLKDKGLPTEVLAQGRFLFGTEILRDLEEMHRLIVLLEVRDAYVVELIEAKFREMMVALKPYLRMDHKMPRAPWFGLVCICQ